MATTTDTTRRPAAAAGVSRGMARGMARAVADARRNREHVVAALSRFVAIPSVSAQPAHAPDVARAARWLADHLGRIGLERVEVVPTRGHPLVYADWVHRRGGPTLLVYGHYDVQPPDPLEAWRTPPFRPTVRGDDLVGRGTSDDKGQLFVHLAAMESWLRATGGLPVNVRCVFEGEEEVGSPNLRLFLERRRHGLRADAAVVSDTRMLGPDRPALTYSLRGALGLEVEVAGPRSDLHSGSFGGAVAEPLRALCAIVASLHDDQGRVAVPGFSACVRPPSPEERAFMARTGPSDADVLGAAPGARGAGEPGWSAYERTTVRPALSVAGITGGYQGPGPKAVIPARATAKLHLRLVPDQDPAEIERLVRRHVARVSPPGLRVSVRTLARAEPAEVERRHPAMRAAAAAYRVGFGRSPALLRSGGTIPVVNDLREVLGLPTVLMGFGLPDDNRHAPNERLHLPTLHRGVATSIAFLAFLAGMREAEDAGASRR